MGSAAAAAAGEKDTAVLAVPNNCFTTQQHWVHTSSGPRLGYHQIKDSNTYVSMFPVTPPNPAKFGRKEWECSIIVSAIFMAIYVTYYFIWGELHYHLPETYNKNRNNPIPDYDKGEGLD